MAGVQHAAGQLLTAQRRNPERGHGSDVVEVCLMVKVKADAVRAILPRNLER